ncbi:MAG: DUF4382 domain-containing protein [Rubrobacter sp.]|nr:DUF4382 domain-containing protein [Rubrobacter sp.]
MGLAGRKLRLTLGLLLCGALVAAGCGGGDPGTADEEAANGESGEGELEVRADGEERARDGFTSMDGWDLQFDSMYVTFAEVTAYQSDPPYDPDEREEEVQAEEEAVLDGVHTVDLTEGDEQAPSVPVGDIPDAPAGQYDALSWEMVEAEEGPAEGASFFISGTAERDGETVDFTLPIEQQYSYTCGDYVGEERKGVLEDGGEADLEATFHIDHLFGDITAAEEDPNALGFDPLAEAAEDGTLEADLATLEGELSEEDYQTLVDALPTTGHVGEGHCYEANSGATG